MTIATKLSEARKLIERGWCQGKFRKYVGDEMCYCADGALCAVFPLSSSSGYKLANSHLQQAVGVKEHAYIWEWNDAPERTQAEVIEAFKRAEQLARDGAE